MSPQSRNTAETQPDEAIGKTQRRWQATLFTQHPQGEGDRSPFVSAPAGPFGKTVPVTFSRLQRNLARHWRFCVWMTGLGVGQSSNQRMLASGGGRVQAGGKARRKTLLPGLGAVGFFFPLVWQAVSLVKPTSQIDLATPPAAEGRRGGLVGVDRLITDWTVEQRHRRLQVSPGADHKVRWLTAPARKTVWR